MTPSVSGLAVLFLWGGMVAASAAAPPSFAGQPAEDGPAEQLLTYRNLATNEIRYGGKNSYFLLTVRYGALGANSRVSFSLNGEDFPLAMKPAARTEETIRIPLRRGLNEVKLVAIDDLGRDEDIFRIDYQPPDPRRLEATRGGPDSHSKWGPPR